MQLFCDWLGVCGFSLIAQHDEVALRGVRRDPWRHCWGSRRVWELCPSEKETAGFEQKAVPAGLDWTPTNILHRGAQVFVLVGSALSGHKDLSLKLWSVSPLHWERFWKACCGHDFVGFLLSYKMFLGLIDEILDEPLCFMWLSMMLHHRRGEGEIPTWKCRCCLD